MLLYIQSMSLIWTHKFAINSTTEVTHDSLKSMLTTNTRFEHLQQTYVLSRDISLIFVLFFGTVLMTLIVY